MRDKLSVVFKLPLIIVRYYCNLSLPPIEPSGDVPIVALYPVRSFFLAVAGEHWCEFRPSEKEECGSTVGEDSLWSGSLQEHHLSQNALTG
jgi:hypothetical protein